MHDRLVRTDLHVGVGTARPQFSSYHIVRTSRPHSELHSAGCGIACESTEYPAFAEFNSRCSVAQIADLPYRRRQSASPNSELSYAKDTKVNPNSEGRVLHESPCLSAPTIEH